MPLTSLGSWDIIKTIEYTWDFQFRSNPTKLVAQRTLQILFFGIAVGLLAVWGFQSWKVIRSGKSESRPFEAASDADMTVRGFSLVQTTEGSPEWRITAEKAVVLEDRQEARLEGVHVKVETREGIQLEFSGDQAEVDMKTQDFVVRNAPDGPEIEIRLGNGYTVFTRTIRWVNLSRRLESDEPVRVRAPGLAITGGGFVGNLADGEFHFIEDVHVQVDQ